MTSVAPARSGPRATARIAARKASRSAARRTAVRTAGELMITAGVIVLLYVVYELLWTGVGTAQAQGDLREQLTQQWDAPPPSGGPSPPSSSEAPSASGADGVAIVRIPKLGSSYAWVIVEGVSQADLRLGPGHYPDSAAPGEIGNFAVAGHRTTYGAPFSGLDALDPGDPIVIETADTYFTYLVDDTEVVQPTRLDVVLPVPGAPGRSPTEALMTFTTCHPRYAATERLVVFSHLDSEQPKSAGLPPALAG